MQALKLFADQSRVYVNAGFTHSPAAPLCVSSFIDYEMSSVLGQQKVIRPAVGGKELVVGLLWGCLLFCEQVAIWKKEIGCPAFLD